MERRENKEVETGRKGGVETGDNGKSGKMRENGTVGNERRK